MDVTQETEHFLYLSHIVNYVSIPLIITMTNLGEESRFFFTLIKGKEPPSQPSYDPGETQHIISLSAFIYTGRE